MQDSIRRCSYVCSPFPSLISLPALLPFPLPHHQACNKLYQLHDCMNCWPLYCDKFIHNIKSDLIHVAILSIFFCHSDVYIPAEFKMKSVVTADKLPHKRVNLKDTWKTRMGAGEHTGVSSQIRTKLSDRAVWQARAGCYSQAALSSNDSKPR